MPDIDLPEDGELNWGEPLRTSIELINAAVDDGAVMNEETYQAALDAKLEPAEYRVIAEGNLGLTPLMFQGMSRNASGGTVQSATYQMRLQQRIRGHGHRFLFTNYHNGGASSIEAATGNPITVKASLLIATGTGPLVPLTFGGASTVVIPSGGQVYSDPIEIDLAQGAYAWMLTYVSVANLGEKWPNVSYGNAGAFEGVTNSSDVTGNVAGATAANGYVYGPIAAYGIAGKDTRTARPAIIGDSIGRGATTSRDIEGLNILPPLSQTAVTNIAAYGELGAGFAAPAGHRFRTGLLAGCTSWLCEYGANDVKAGAPTLASIAATWIKNWQIAYDRMGPGYQTTITPQTTSTDSWATTTNQAIAGAPFVSATRIAVNDWLRDGAPMLNGVQVATGSSAVGTVRAGQAGHMLTGYFDWADAVETVRNSGIFKAAYSFDGIHLSPTGYAAVNTATDWTKLGIV